MGIPESPEERAARARAALESLPPGELRKRKQRAARASAAARRQQRDERIVLQIQPAHKLSPEQLVAWRRLWAILLDTGAVEVDDRPEPREGGRGHA